MKKIYCKYIPASGFKAMCLWPLLIIRKGMAWAFRREDEQHENIHGEQQKEMLIVGAVLAGILWALGCGWWSLLALPLFFYWYGMEWLVKCAYYRNPKTAYKNVAHEREAYAHQNDVCYIDNRKHFAWVKYIVT